MAKFSTSRQKAALRKYARNIKYLMVVASTAVIVFTLPKQVKFSYEIEKGRIWNQKDLVSPYNFAILKTPQEIENDKKVALANIMPVYQLNDNMQPQQIAGFKADMDIKWRSANISDNQKNKYLVTGVGLLTAVYNKGI